MEEKEMELLTQEEKVEPKTEEKKIVEHLLKLQSFWKI